MIKKIFVHLSISSALLMGCERVDQQLLAEVDFNKISINGNKIEYVKTNTYYRGDSILFYTIDTVKTELHNPSNLNLYLEKKTGKISPKPYSNFYQMYNIPLNEKKNN